MRKALILLVVFAVVGAAAFADVGTAKWAITTDYGFGIVTGGDTAIADTTVVPFDWSSETLGRTRLGFTYTSADGNAGFNSRLQMIAENGSAVFNQLNGWGKFFGGALTVRAGILDDYTIATTDWNDFGNTDGSFGIYFNFSLVPGLDIGFFQAIPHAIPAVSLTGTWDSAYLDYGDIIGLAYAMKDIGNLQLGVILLPSDFQTDMLGTAIYAGFNLKMVKDLTATIEGKATLGDGNTPMQLDEHVAYAMGAFTVGAYIGEYSDGSDFYWGFEPTGTYKFNDNLSFTAVASIYNNPLPDKTIFVAAPIYTNGPFAGYAGDPKDLNFGAGASVSYTASGFTLTIGDYYAAASDAGNVFYINGDLSL